MVGSGSGGASARFTPSWDDGRYALGEKLGEDVGWAHLGDLLERGVGGPVELERAVDCDRRALALDDGRALLALGRLLIEGKGVARDPVEARQLLERALGHDELRDAARAQLARLP